VRAVKGVGIFVLDLIGCSEAWGFFWSGGGFCWGGWFFIAGFQCVLCKEGGERGTGKR